MTRTPLFVKKQYGGLFAIEDTSLSTGSRFYVDSVTGTDAAGYGSSPDKPVATIEYAVGLCTDSMGDIIYVMPAHQETISAAGSCVVDKIGVKIIGLGFGANRPLLTYTTAAGATVSVTAPSVTIENLQFYANYTGGVSAAVTVGADAEGFRLKNCRFEEAANTKEFLIAVSVTAGCHDVGVEGCDFFGVTGGSDTGCIVFAGASNFSFVRNCRLFGDWSGATIDFTGAASTYVEVGNCVVCNDDTDAGLVISFHNSTTGLCHDCSVYSAKDTVGPAGAAMAFAECYTTNALNKNGILKPGADS